MKITITRCKSAPSFETLEKFIGESLNKEVRLTHISKTAGNHVVYNSNGVFKMEFTTTDGETVSVEVECQK